MTETITKTPIDNDIMLDIIDKCGVGKLATYVCILFNRDKDTGKCCPSLRRLNEMMKFKSKETLQRHLDSLCDNGFLIVNSGVKGKSNSYYFPKEKFNTEKDFAEMAAAVRKRKEK